MNDDISFKSKFMSLSHHSPES